jgi:hypothetical protein
LNDLIVKKIGSIAAEVLSRNTAGKVAGITSRGVFLRIGDRILFLTTADYRSPFNLTLGFSDSRFEQLQAGDQVIIRQNELLFPRIGLIVKTDSADLWTPNSPAILATSPANQLALAEKWIALLRSKDPTKGFLFLADPMPANNDSMIVQKAHSAVSGMVKSFKERDLGAFLTAANLIIGAGGGLTPSGDDVLTGFFLYHVRYDQALEKPRLFVHEWCTEMVKLAFQKTTTISANRLEAAAAGMSEEIFLRLIDALFDPSIQLPDDNFDMLLNFGHSSGVDTLMGIYFGIKSLL